MYRGNLLRKCLTAWQLFVELQVREKNILTEQQQTKNKMAAFLEAASTGKCVVTCVPVSSFPFPRLQCFFML